MSVLMCFVGSSTSMKSVRGSELLRVHGRERVWPLLLYEPQDPDLVVPSIRPLVCNELVECDTERPDVRLFIVGLEFKDFGEIIGTNFYFSPEVCEL